MKVLISGGSRGLGAELARSFVADGHEVVTFGRNSSPLPPGEGSVSAPPGGNAGEGAPVREVRNRSTRTPDAPSPQPSPEGRGSQSGSAGASPSIRKYRGDVNDDAFLKKLLHEQGDCDCLINNAGVAFDGVLATQSIESIDTLLDTNLRAAIVLSKLFVREHLARDSAGSIINISSIIAIRGYAGLAVYSATKAGLLGMTRALARELGPKGFRVNAVLPGYFESEMSAGLKDEQRAQIIRRTPLGRLATAQDVAGAVRFLASDTASFITGQCLAVDGGITC